MCLSSIYISIGVCMDPAQFCFRYPASEAMFPVMDSNVGPCFCASLQGSVGQYTFALTLYVHAIVRRVCMHSFIYMRLIVMLGCLYNILK